MLKDVFKTQLETQGASHLRTNERKQRTFSTWMAHVHRLSFSLFSAVLLLCAAPTGFLSKHMSFKAKSWSNNKTAIKIYTVVLENLEMFEKHMHNILCINMSYIWRLEGELVLFKHYIPNIELRSFLLKCISVCNSAHQIIHLNMCTEFRNYIKQYKLQMLLTGILIY